MISAQNPNKLNRRGGREKEGELERERDRGRSLAEETEMSEG